MHYLNELKFTRMILKNMGLSTYISNGIDLPENIDHGLRQYLGISRDIKKTLSKINEELKNNTIYMITDEFMCNYIVFLLPDSPDKSIFICGPYITAELTKKKLMQNAEKYDISPQFFSQLNKYYGNITLINDESLIFSLFGSLGEVIWKNIDNFSIQRYQKNPAPNDAVINSENKYFDTADESLLTVNIIEARYEAERRLMEAVSKGQYHKVSLLMGHASEFVFENRTDDEIRNTKNYMIIMNTLLRKAVQEGGVPPYFIDKLSSEFAKKIENTSAGKISENIALEMIEKYSSLVNEHSLKKYSASVQKAMAVIDCDLTADLSLKTMSKTLGMNTSYFSSLFKKETGKTYTDYVNEQRMQNAKRLLKNTTLQIQTVAQHCGILDVNYFTKLFKKYNGITPGKFRDK